ILNETRKNMAAVLTRLEIDGGKEVSEKFKALKEENEAYDRKAAEYDAVYAEYITLARSGTSGGELREAARRVESILAQLKDRNEAINRGTAELNEKLRAYAKSKFQI